MNEKKVTIYDIAEALGISSGTVCRALNNKGRISAATKKRVLEKAEELGYTTNLAAQSLGRNPVYIGVLLCCPVEAYMNEIERGIKAMFAELLQFKVFPEIHKICDNAEGNEKEIEKVFKSFRELGCKGVALFLCGDSGKYKDTVNELEEEGIPVAAIVTDIEGSKRSVFVETDGAVSGMLAAELLYQICDNRKIAILTGFKDTSAHKNNIDGFMTYAKNHEFETVDIFEHHDEKEKAIKLMKEIFKKDAYDGLYIASACSIYLQQSRRRFNIPKNLKIVTTDLFQENRELLGNETICATIFQDPYLQGKRAIELLYRIINQKSEGEEFRVTPQLIFKSNRNIYLEKEE